MPLNIDDNRIALAIPAFLRLAFRPLFFGGILFSIIAIAWWTYFWINPSDWMPHGGPIWWHGHEMLFGFGAAIVVGFLLTAVQSWTGVTGLRNKPLAVLVLCWLAGRLLLAFGSALPAWFIALVDVAYLLLACAAMAYPVIKAKQWHNFMFVPMLFALALLNAVGHWAVITEQPQLAIRALHGTIMVFTLIIAVLGGRVIPAFTSNSTGCKKRQPVRWLEIISITSIMLLILIAFTGFDNVDSILLFVVSISAALFNGWRYLRWGIQYSLMQPLLWSLHLAYAFIPLGFIMLALHGAGLMDNPSAALHCFTVGAMGGMILAMISRVTLGHTGRPLNLPALLPLAYVFMIIAAFSRVILPAWFPELTQWGISIAGVLWLCAFGLYIYYYAPMLLSPRVDGSPG